MSSMDDPNIEQEVQERLAQQFPNQLLNLEITAEEAAEVIEEAIKSLSRIIRMKSKCVRFGNHDYHPRNMVENADALAVEYGQLKAMFDILMATGVINHETVEIARQGKLEKLPKWYGENRG